MTFCSPLAPCRLVGIREDVVALVVALELIDLFEHTMHRSVPPLPHACMYVVHMSLPVHMTCMWAETYMYMYSYRYLLVVGVLIES